MSKRVLVVEDDAPLAEFIGGRLRDDHFVVDIVHARSEAQLLISSDSHDLLILDLALLDIQGLEVLRWAHAKRPDLLILVLTGSPSPEDCVQALDAGADDYITKPFSSAELSARIRALIRRSMSASPATNILKVEDLELDRMGRSVQRGGYKIDLTQKEFVLLEFLMQRPQQPVARTAINEHAWGLAESRPTNVVDVYINYLRKKIDFGFDRPLIRTIRGVGYQIGGAPEIAV